MIHKEIFFEFFKARRSVFFVSFIVVLVAGIAWFPTRAGQKTKVWHDAPEDAQAALPAGYSPLPSLKEVIKKLRPAVVNVYTTQVIKPRQKRQNRRRLRNPFFDDFFHNDGMMERFFNAPRREMKRNSLGSGFIISQDGYVITNHHVVADATEINIRLSDDNTYKAKVIGSDKRTDVALLKIDAKEKLPFVRLGDSDDLEVGDWAIAIGNPFGLGHTVTAGIISAKDRQIGQGPYDDFLQTDAAINPGNSGGPLFDSAGRVVGINTAIVAGGTGIGFAVPINLAKSLLPQLHLKGKVVRGWLGVGIQALTDELSKRFSLPSKQGALVSQVFEDGPADKAGFKAGDIIVSIDGQKTKDNRHLLAQIAIIAPGNKIKVIVLRDGKKKMLTVTLAERDAGEARALGVESEQADDNEVLGLSLSPLTPRKARRLGLSEDLRGVLVDDVDRDSSTAGVIQPGDVILEVNRRRVTTVREFRRSVDRKQNSVLLRIQRGRSQLFVVVDKAE
jgi:serine protease Do